MIGVLERLEESNCGGVHVPGRFVQKLADPSVFVQLIRMSKRTANNTEEADALARGRATHFPAKAAQLHTKRLALLSPRSLLCLHTAVEDC